MIKEWNETDADWRRNIKVKDKKSHSQVNDSGKYGRDGKTYKDCKNRLRKGKLRYIMPKNKHQS